MCFFEHDAISGGACLGTQLLLVPFAKGMKDKLSFNLFISLA